MLNTILKGLERRNAPQAVYPPAALGSAFPFRMFRNTTGQAVTVDSALELVPVYAAVGLLAGAIGSLPLKVYRDAEPRTEARTSRQWKLLHDAPNDEMAADEFWEITTASLLLWGNAFLWKQRDTGGVVQSLWPIRPNRVMVGREKDGAGTRRFFHIDMQNTRYYETDILHIRGLGTDGLVGLSPVQQARQQLANDQAHEEFLGTFLKNGLFSSAVFTHPNRLSADAQQRLRDQIEDRSGWLEAGKAITLEEGADLKTLTMPLADAQFVEQANLSEHRVAQLFGLVPPHQWGISAGGKSMTYTNSEFGGLEFVKWSVRRWLVRIESSLKRDPGLFPAPGPVLFPEFVVDALLRADTKTRFEAFQIAINAGFMSVAQVQAIENIEPDDTQLTGMVEPDSPPALPAGETPVLPAGNAPAALPAPRSAPQVEAFGVLEELRTIFRPEIRVEIPPTVVHVESQRQLPPDVIVTAPDMTPIAAALDRLTEAVTGKELTVSVDVAAPAVTVNQPTTPVQLTLIDDDTPMSMNVEFLRNPNGTIKSAKVTED